MFKDILILLIMYNIVYANDNDLRQLAFEQGLKPIPSTFQEIKKLFDTKNNPITQAKIKLGYELFNDKNLSLSKKISCASCHDIKNGGEDGKPTAIGHKNRKNPHHLNTPTVLNSAFATSFFWDGSSPTLAHQAKGPIQASFEMASTPQLIVKRVKENPKYQKQFKDIFKNNISITFDNVTKIIATYEKTLLTRSAFDKFLEGNDNAINKKAKEGLEFFINIGCKGCHYGEAIGGKMLQKFPLRNYTGLFAPTFLYDGRRKLNNVKIQFGQKAYKYPFDNKGNFLGKKGTKLFRVPILRNITKTAPYFHNGMVKDLQKAIFIMGRYQLGIDLNKKQISKIEEFLKTLDGDIIDINTISIKP
jgi:cytochrome c peroxidase